jgi:hypothetical protein
MKGNSTVLDYDQHRCPTSLIRFPMYSKVSSWPNRVPIPGTFDLDDSSHIDSCSFPIPSLRTPSLLGPISSCHNGRLSNPLKDPSQ